MYKRQPIEDLGSTAREFVQAMAQTLGCMVCISDHDQIVAAGGSRQQDYQGKSISKELEEVIRNRETLCVSEGEKQWIPIVEEEKDRTGFRIIYPILAAGDVIGAVAVSYTHLILTTIPHNQDDYGIHNHLESRKVQNCMAAGIVADIHKLLIDFFKLFCLMILPDKGLDRPNSCESFLNAIVQMINGILLSIVQGTDPANDESKDQTENRSTDYEYKGKTPVQDKGEGDSHNQHDGASD